MTEPPHRDPADYTDITYTVTGSVANIELNRPHALNAWTLQTGAELLHAIERTASDDRVRAVLVTGAGTAFCAGADVKSARESTRNGYPDLSSRLRTHYNPIVMAIREAAKPFVAAVQGPCAGLRVSLALACDLLVASEDAYLLLAFVRIGVMPDAGATAFLVERIGLTRANQLCMLGEKLSAVEAESWGLVNAVHPRDELRSAGEALAERLAAGPTVAIGNMKRALTAAAQSTLRGHLELEAALQHRHGNTADYSEGRAAFVEKRPTAFTGR